MPTYEYGGMKFTSGTPLSADELDEVFSSVQTTPGAIAKQTPTEKEGTPWSTAAKGAVVNFIPSVGNMLGGIAQTIAHPIDTAESLGQIVGGGLISSLPESAKLWAIEHANNPAKLKQSIDKAGQVGEFYKQRYGSEEGFKQAIASDPAGVAADFATVLTGGGAAVAKIPKLAGIGKGIVSTGKAIDPLSATVKVGGMLGRKAAGGVADIVGSIGTHTGGESIRQVFKAGTEGGEAAATTTAHLRGNLPMEDILSQAKGAVANLRAKRGEEYRAGMGNVAANTAQIDFAPIETATNNSMKIGSFKGKTLDKSAASVKEQISAIVDDWKQSDPTEFHTAEGLDALKQAIGDVRDNAPFGTPARVVADRAYNSVKAQINKYAPDYAKTMKDYELASTQIGEIEKSLSLGNKASADTAIRKLQSVLRKSGNRAELANILEEAGARGLQQNLAGQSLQSLVPVGLGKLATTGIAGAGVLTANPAAIPLALLQSPRLIGEATMLLGRGTGIAKKGTAALNSLAKRYGVDPTILANYIYQANQPKGEQQ